jgi:hypothetical protein
MVTLADLFPLCLFPDDCWNDALKPVLVQSPHELVEFSMPPFLIKLYPYLGVGYILSLQIKIILLKGCILRE